MIRVIVLDASSMYCQIFDEFYCNENEYDEKIKTYSSSKKLLFIKITY